MSTTPAIVHTPVITLIERISDGAVRVCVRCCNDPSTDSMYTEYFAPDTDFTQVQTNIEAHKTRVANLHATMLNIQSFLTTL